MAKKRSPNFGEGFSSGFNQMAHDVMLQTLREMAAEPERQQRMTLNARADTRATEQQKNESPFLTDSEQKALETLYEKPAGSFQGVRRNLLDSILPRTYTDVETGRVTQVGPRGKALPPAPVAVDPETGATVQMPRGGRVVTSPGTGQAKATLSTLNSFERTFAEYNNLLEKLPSGRIAGASADLLNRYTGAFKEAKAARALEGVMTPMAARVLGGDVGNLNEQEQKRAQDAVKFLNGTVEERKQGAQILLGLIRDKRAAATQQLSPGIFKKGQKGGVAEASPLEQMSDDELRRMLGVPKGGQ